MVGIVAILSCEVRHRDLARSMQRSPHLTSLLWAVGVVTFLLSVASPYDDAFQLRRERNNLSTLLLGGSTNRSTKASGDPIRPRNLRGSCFGILILDGLSKLHTNVMATPSGVDVRQVLASDLYYLA